MAAPKTRPNRQTVTGFLDRLDDGQKRRDARKLMKLMRDVIGERARMWGDSIVGFGSYHYRYASGREGDWFLTGFSPRKQALSIYIMPGYSWPGNLMKKLGRYRTGKACLYVKKLDDVDLDVLRELIEQSVRKLRKSQPRSG